MKALLYEPGTRGHRPVILRYLSRCLEQNGIDYHALTDEPENGASKCGEIDWLTSVARAQHCSHIHVMTFDSKGPAWLRYRRLRRRADIPVIASYYLFNNLYEFPKCVFWDLLFARNLVGKVIVTDEFLRERRLPFWRRNRIAYAPDPYDPQEFPHVEQDQARAVLGLPTDRTIFMMFGELSESKGLMTLVDAAKKIPASSPACVLLAGRLSEEMKSRGVVAAIQPLIERGTVILYDRFIEEKDVSAYFSAADYILSPYPRWFKVSSGSFTRACAAGRPAIASGHGMLKEMIDRTGCGLTFAPEDASSLADCLVQAVEIRNSPRYETMSSMGRLQAERQTVQHFGKAVIKAYRELLNC